jgi:DNA topoisomerase-1
MKFRRLADFGRHLSKLRKSVTRDLRTKSLSRNRVLAGIVALLDLTLIRVGNKEYVRENGSYGLTTLRTRHVLLKNGRVRLRFRAKGGTMREVGIEEKRLVKLFRELVRLRGAHVFQYFDEQGTVHQANAAEVNDYLRQSIGKDFTAKDFRTWKASAMAVSHLRACGMPQGEKERRGTVKRVVADVAAALGNTPAICRKYYIHADLLEDFLLGTSEFIRNGQSKPAAESARNVDKLFGRYLRRWMRSHCRSAS